MRKKTILIADDEREILQAIMKAVISKRRLYYEPLVCVDGYETLEILREKDIDLVVLDLNMSNLDGIDVCRSLASDPMLKDIPVIISSAYLDDSMKLQLKTFGIHHFLQKPYPMEELIKEIDQILLSPANTK